jgi:hypothetical protein
MSMRSCLIFERVAALPPKIAKICMSKQPFPAIDLFAAQLMARRRIRMQWKKSAGRLIDAHLIAFSALASVIVRFSERHFEKQSKAVEGRLALSAQFIHGVEICEVTISEGLYCQAAALLKQELETVAAIDEFEKNRRRDGRTPNVGIGVTSEFGPIYGDLNSIAHVSRHDLLAQLVVIVEGVKCGPTVLPEYNEQIARFLYGNHVYFICEVTRQMGRLFEEIFGDGLSEAEVKWASTALSTLLNEKVIKLPH